MAQPAADGLQSALRKARQLHQSLTDKGVGWDYLVLTASTPRQADGYRLQLDRRARSGLLPRSTKTIALPDPQGRRVGSGGATLWALRKVCEDILLTRPERRSASSVIELLSGLRILIIHSGGDSRRMPHCSPSGKIFVKLPLHRTDGASTTLFDEVLYSVAPICAGLREGTVILSGDVLLSFDAGKVAEKSDDVIGVAARVEAQTASRHGVYVLNSRGEINDFLQKPSIDEMQTKGASDADGAAMLDTGILVFNARASAALALLGGVISEKGRAGIAASPFMLETDRPLPLDLYTDITQSLLGNGRIVEGIAPEKLKSIVANALSGLSFAAYVADPCDFLHIGTTAQFRDAFTKTSAASELYSFGRRINCIVQEADISPDAAVQDSILVGPECRVDADAVVQDCDIRAGSVISGGAVCVGLRLVSGRFELLLDEALVRIPIAGPDAGETVVCMNYGVCDDPKKAMIFGSHLDEWRTLVGADVGEIWPDVTPGERSLWNAQIFPILNEDFDVDVALLPRNGRNEKDRILRWRKARRLSMAQIAQAADVPRMLEESLMNDARRKAIEALELIKTSSDCQPSESIGSPAGTAELAAMLDEFERSARDCSDPALRIRIWKLMADATSECAISEASEDESNRPGDPPEARLARRVLARAEGRSALAGMYDNLAFSTLAGILERNFTPLVADPRCALKFGERIEVSCPIRVDLAGGWTDTPPYCIERGGVVLNVALNLEGKSPVTVAARPLKERVIRLRSVDQKHEQVLTDIEDILGYSNPADTLAILKASLVLAGIVPNMPGRDLVELLDKFGAGIEMVMDIDVPKGSGLGTSSIAAATAVACASGLVGLSPNVNQLFDAVLSLEQMLTTGGGWQDQVGGIVPGIKITTTNPGMPQIPAIRPVTMSRETVEGFHRRFMLFYTGRSRIAKNILRTVVSRWIRREPEAVRALDGLKAIARAIDAAFQSGDLDEVGRLMRQQWETNKILDPHSTDATFNELFNISEPFVSGAKLAGAGGGGFMALMLREDTDRDALERALTGWSGPNGRIFPCSLNNRGINVVRTRD
ncbi:MAG TPA: L-fucokinase [Candidatus Brocadiia bacterium]|nr:L-fucokinase [Candidatus Brocadiia bacterium]